MPISIPLTTALWGLWLVIALVWLIVTIMFQYHWSSYAKHDGVVTRAMIAYYSLSVLLLGLPALLIATL